MENYTDIIMNLITLIGGGGLGWLITAKWERKKAKGEASQQEAVAAKEWQEVYTKALKDSNDRNDELREDNKLLREENEKILSKFKEYDEDREKMRDKMIVYDDEMSKMKKSLLDNSLKIQKVLPFVCQVVSCPNRVRISPEDFMNDVG